MMRRSPPDCSILVVDDDEDLRELMAQALTEEGYQVETAANGAAAATLLNRYIPTAILLDMRMPVLDGWGFMEVLRARHVATKVIVVTAAQDARRWAEEVGASDFLGKPFDLDELFSAIARACGVTPRR